MLRVRDEKTETHRVIIVEPKIPNDIHIFWIPGWGSVLHEGDAEIARRLAQSGYTIHYLLLPGQGSPELSVKNYDDLVRWALQYIHRVNPPKVVVVGHSLGGEVAKGVVWRLLAENRHVVGIGIAPAGSRKEARYRAMAELGRVLAIWRRFERGVSIRQLFQYIKLLKGEGYKIPPSFEIIHGTNDLLVPKDWRHEFRRGGHFPFSYAPELARRIEEAATRLRAT